MTRKKLGARRGRPGKVTDKEMLDELKDAVKAQEDAKPMIEIANKVIEEKMKDPKDDKK